MGTFLGMDPEAVEAKAKAMQVKAREIDTIKANLMQLVNGLDGVWRGQDMQRFQNDFRSSYAPVLDRIADGLEQLAHKARANANQQRQTSAC